MRYLTMAVAALITIAASATAQTAPTYGPAEAIAAIDAAPEHEVRGVFEMNVESVGASGFNVYLNSSPDYRAAGNFSVELHPAAVNAIQAKTGQLPDVALLDKRVRVTGVGRRYHIETSQGGYYQYRVEVDAPDQITVVE